MIILGMIRDRNTRWSTILMIMTAATAFGLAAGLAASILAH